MMGSLRPAQVFGAVACLVMLGALAAGSAEAQEQSGTDLLSQYQSACGTGATEGNAEACYRLGGLHWEGIKKDKMKAVLLFQRACKRNGKSRACLRLGEIYENGDVSQKDPYLATIIYQTACDAGSQEGCSRASKLYASLGVPLKESPGAPAPAQPSGDVNAQAGETSQGSTEKLTTHERMRREMVANARQIEEDKRLRRPPNKALIKRHRAMVAADQEFDAHLRELQWHAEQDPRDWDAIERSRKALEDAGKKFDKAAQEE